MADCHYPRLTENVLAQHHLALHRLLHEVVVDGGQGRVHHEGDEEEEHGEGADT